MELYIREWLPLIAALSIAGLIITLSYRVLFSRGLELTAEQRLPRQFIFIILVLVAVIAITLSLPVSESSRNQVLALIGVLVSGVIAFSSTTLVSNLIAGLVLRFNRPFRTGDFIRCNEFFGRVSEKGLLDTEIQTEQRELISIANSYLVNNPVSVVRASGTLISATVSIGYDVHHKTVTQLLEQAVQQSGLNDGFVQVTELGDFSVSYKVSGLLTDVKRLLTAKSKLHCAILDTLHNHSIEIMSPNVVMQRPSEATHKLIPPSLSNERSQIENTDSHEDIAFDKAEQAEQHEQSVTSLQTALSELNTRLENAQTSDEKQQLKTAIQELQTELQQKTSEKPISSD